MELKLEPINGCMHMWLRHHMKGKHAEDCPMGQFYRLAEMRTARRCAEIADRVDGPATYIGNAIRTEFELEASDNPQWPVGIPYKKEER